jgi:hypothetical protein
MGWFKKAFKKVAKVATFGAYRGGGSGGGVVEAPTPAPEITLNQKDEGEAKEKVENAKLKARKGKKALKISKDEAPATGVGRNIV